MDVKQTLIDAQAAVIGSVLISPEIVGDVMLRVSAEDFLTPEYRHVYDAIRAQWSACQTVDVVTVLHRLGDAYRQMLVQIMADTPTAANWEAYADVMREQARLARIKDAAAKMLDAVTLDEARAAVEVASECLCDSKTLRVVSWHQGLCEFYQRHADGHQPDYLRWGIRQLDERLYAERGDLIILGGLPSSGKTLLATQFAMHMARSGLRVGIFSLETSDAKLYDRMVAQTEGINFGRIKRNQMVLDDYKTASTAIQTAQRITLDVIRASGFGVADVQAVAMARRYDVIVIDYVQLLQAKGSTRVEQVTNISLALHTMAQRAGIAVIALSQLSRPEKGQQRSRTPSMSDLRESGQLEQDADAIMILAAQPGGNRVLSIVKNKEGERGAIELVFDAAHLRMTPLVSKSDTAADHDDEDDWPRMQAWPRTAERGGELP